MSGSMSSRLALPLLWCLPWCMAPTIGLAALPQILMSLSFPCGPGFFPYISQTRCFCNHSIHLTINLVNSSSPASETLLGILLSSVDTYVIPQSKSSKLLALLCVQSSPLSHCPTLFKEGVTLTWPINSRAEWWWQKHCPTRWIPCSPQSACTCYRCFKQRPPVLHPRTQSVAIVLLFPQAWSIEGPPHHWP